MTRHLATFIRYRRSRRDLVLRSSLPRPSWGARSIAGGIRLYLERAAAQSGRPPAPYQSLRRRGVSAAAVVCGSSSTSRARCLPLEPAINRVLRQSLTVFQSPTCLNCYGHDMLVVIDIHLTSRSGGWQRAATQLCSHVSQLLRRSPRIQVRRTDQLRCAPAMAAASASEPKCVRTARDIAAEISRADALAHVNLVERQVNARGCWIPVGKSRNTDGYVQVWLTGSAPGRRNQRAYLLHKLAMWAFGKALPTGKSEHASHLCDERACFNPGHLVAESIQANNSRKGCPGDVRCACGCNVVAFTCPHIPRCVRNVDRH